jgi:hypothetical protein
MNEKLEVFFEIIAFLLKLFMEVIIMVVKILFVFFKIMIVIVTLGFIGGGL